MDSSIRASQPPLVPAKGTALHRQVFLAVRDQISSGVYVAGGVLPKEEALCQRFGVSRITVRRALADLVAQGLVERRQGLGTFVRRDVPQPRERPTLSLVAGLRQTVDETEVTVLDVSQAEAPPEIADSLQLGGSKRAVHAVRLRRIGSTPVLLTDAWIPIDLGKRMTAAALRKSALLDLVEAQGVKLGRVVQEITAVVADAERAAQLQTEPGSPLLKVVRLMHGVDARPVAFITALLCPERSRLLMDIASDEVNTLSAGKVVHDIR